MTGDSVLPNGHEVKRLRRSRGWTQNDLAQRIQDRAGPFSKRTLQSIEAGRSVHLRSIRLVAEELGTDVTRLLQDHVASSHNLPSPLTSFIGRESELVEIEHLLDAHRLLTLTGAGGSGKSRLALEVARDLVPDHADGVWLVELAPLSAPDLVPQALASVLGAHEERNRPLTEILRDRLKHRQTLVVLDNCEHLIDACAQLVSALMPTCPQLRILATSRESMNIAGEFTYKVPPLTLPDASRDDRLDELVDVESVRLFVERAAAVRADFALSTSNASAVATICRHLDGIPLALELAAARVRTISVDEIAERLADRFRLLEDAHRESSCRHRTLRALIDWSHELLSSDERVLLRRLSAFAGGWTLPAAERVCGDDDIQSTEVLPLLSKLVDKSLVEVGSDEAQNTGRSRYRLLETVRQYARERLIEDEDEARAVSQRHRDFFLALAEEAEPELDGPDQRAWLLRLGSEHDNLRAALKACTEESDGGKDVGLRLAGALGLYWEICGYQSEGLAMCTQLLTRTGAEISSAIRAKALRTAGRLAELLGQTAEAHAAFDDSLTICRELDDRIGIAASLNELGVVASDHGDLSRARELHAKSLAIRSELGDKRGIANSLMNLAVVTRKRGDHAGAREHLEKSLALRRQMGDKRGIAMVLANLGNVAHARRQFAEAHAAYSESLVMFRELGDKRGVSNTLNNLGNIARRRHDDGAARSYYEGGLSIARELGDPRGISRALQNLGNMALSRGDYGEARVLYEESLAIDRELQDRQQIAQLLVNLAIVARHEGLSTEARSRSEESLAICQELGDRLGVAIAMGELECAAWSEGDHARARSLCKDSLSLFRELDNEAGVAERLVGLACIATHDDRTARAIRLLASARLAGDRIDYSFDRSTEERFEACASGLRAEVDEEAFAREWSAGESMGLDRAIEYALGG